MNYLAFKKFLAFSGLSTRRFGDLCGIGKTTIHRLAQPGHGGLTPQYIRSITPALLRACEGHLTSNRRSADDIHLILGDIFGEAFVPPVIRRAMLTPGMLSFFGLDRDPFAAPGSASGVFLTKETQHILHALDEAIKFQGFACVLAPVGAGKTVIKNLIMGPKSNVQGPRSGSQTLDFGQETLDQTSVILSPKFADPSRVTAAGIVAYALESLGIKPRRVLVLAQKQLEDHLAKLHQGGVSVALCFDECHRLSDQTLSALKNFYELGTGGFERYLGLILFGQPQFKTRLTWPRFREIAERLVVHELPPLSAQDAYDFLTHCLTNASPTGPLTSGPNPAHGAFAPTRGKGAPTFESSKFEVQNSKPGASLVSTACGSGWLNTADPEACVTVNGSEPVLSTSANSPNSANLFNSVNFSPDAVTAIASRASTPLAVANLAAAAMIEAYKKGEREILRRFVPGE